MPPLNLGPQQLDDSGHRRRRCRSPFSFCFSRRSAARSWSHGASSERGLSCTARTRTSVCFRSTFHARNERPSEAAYTLPTRAPLRPAVAQSSKGDTQQQPAAGAAAALPPSGDRTSSEASAEPSAELPVSPSINFRFGAIGVLQMRKDLSPRQVCHFRSVPSDGVACKVR